MAECFRTGGGVPYSEFRPDFTASQDASWRLLYRDGDGWTPEEQAIRDVAYVREYSLWMDLRLLFASLLRALRRERALPASYQPSLGDEALVAETAAR